jgi:hypothetical protein
MLEKDGSREIGRKLEVSVVGPDLRIRITFAIYIRIATVPVVMEK